VNPTTPTIKAKKANFLSRMSIPSGLRALLDRSESSLERPPDARFEQGLFAFPRL